MIKIVDTLNGNKVYFEGSLDELQDMYFENIEAMEEENDSLDLIVSDGLREEMNFYKKAVGYKKMRNWKNYASPLMNFTRC